jgi:hypothetical protein
MWWAQQAQQQKRHKQQPQHQLTKAVNPAGKRVLAAIAPWRYDASMVVHQNLVISMETLSVLL